MNPTLGEAIAGLQDKFFSLTEELHEAHHEIARLRGIPENNLSALRRCVAFHCHPDRGGSDLLMRRLNALFDFLETAYDHCR